MTFQRLLWALAGLIWFLTTFFVSLRMTFPSDTLEERIKWQVQEYFSGEKAIDMGTVVPWGLGLKADSVKWYSVDESGASSLVFFFEDLRARVHPLSLFAATKTFSGSAQMGKGQIDGTMTMLRQPKKVWFPVIQLEASDFPIVDLAPLAGASIEGAGGLQFSLDLESPEGYRKANGTMSLRGENLVVSVISVPDTLLANMDLAAMVGEALEIEQLDITFEITEGRAVVSRGILVSNLVDIELENDITLKAQLGRSILRMNAILEMKEPAASSPAMNLVKNFLENAKWSSDNKYHYRIAGTVSNPRYVPDRERGSRRDRRGRRGTRRRADTTGDDGDLTERRNARRAELRERRKRRRTGGRRSGTFTPDEGDDEMDDLPEDDEPIEDFIEDEQPPEEEEHPPEEGDFAPDE